MKSARITDLITDKISGEWGEEPNNGNGVKVLRTTNFTNSGRLNLESVVVRDVEERLVTKKQLKFGDTIIEKSGGGPKQPVGRVVYFDIDSEEPYLCNNFTAILRPKKVVDSKYFFYSLFAKHGLSTTLKYQNKTTGIINLQLERYLEEEIPLPSLPEQQKIAAILSHVDAAREKRKQANALTEQFLQSTFLTLFGDPVKNEKGWEVVAIGDVVSEIKDGPHVSPNYSETGVPILSTRNIRPYELVLDDMKFVSDEEYNYLTRNFSPKFGDVLLTKGGTTGYAKRVDFHWKFCVWVHLAVLRPKQVVNATYLEGALNSAFCYEQSQFYTHGIANRDLGLKRIAKIKLLLPPLSLQQKFADIVNQTEQLRGKQRQSEQELEELFQSLLQRYFG